MKKTWIVVGTRPEAIKQCPLYLELKRENKLGVALVSSSQHAELLEDALKVFDCQADLTLTPPSSSEDLSQSFSRILNGMSLLIATEKPLAIVVQGDTTTAAATAWAGFIHKVPVVHNEAGLRTFNLHSPFPEEGNRKLITGVAQLHLAPTSTSEKNLRGEGVNAEYIRIVGNTGIDALRMSLDKAVSVRVKSVEEAAGNRKLVLMTAHRRENADSMDEWFRAVSDFAKAHDSLFFVLPLHPNNLAKDAAEKLLNNLPNIFITKPFDFVDTAHLLKKCRFVVSDSGGIQEEAATLGVPTVICRDTTERPEVIGWGTGILSGTSTEGVLNAMKKALELSRPAPFSTDSPFGVGYASVKIRDELLKAKLFSRPLMNEGRD